MKKFAQVNVSTGEVLHIINVQKEFAYTDGATQGGFLFVELDDDINEVEFPKTNYWKNSQWNTREACPGAHYYWRNYAWEKDLGQFWGGVRYQRNNLLSLCDWTQLPDNGLQEGQKVAWQEYRQALRDLTNVFSSAETEEEITWPVLSTEAVFPDEPA